LVFENVDWSNSSRTILDFRGVSLYSQTRILKKLKNNFNVSYQELSPELLVEVEQFFKELCDFDFKAFFDKIFQNKIEFDLCILVREDDLPKAEEVMMIIKGNNPSIENYTNVFCDLAHKMVT
jgi:DNA-binding Lrp family transcriptional regulator